MKIIDLPFLDILGTLTPLVIEAMEAGAVSDRHPTDENLFTLAFETVQKAKAFLKAIDRDAGEPDTEEDAPTK